MEPKVTNGLNIRIHKFFTQADPVRDGTGKDTGKSIFRDYAEYGPPGLADRLSVIARIDRMSRVVEPNSSSANPAEAFAWNRWKYIEPHYNAWKKGEELPLSGTPLAACNFLRADDLPILKQAGIKTAEDLEALLDSNMDKIKLPQMREKRAQAKAFLEARDANAATAKLDSQAQEIAELKAQMAALINKTPMGENPVSSMQADDINDIDENGDRIPKRRGRPPKVQEAA